MAKKFTTSGDLLTAIREEHERLEAKFAPLTEAEMVFPNTMDDQSVKDILAHLVDWEQRIVDWYQTSKRGEEPEVPGPGRNWGQVSIINQESYELHKHESLPDVLAAFHTSYDQTYNLVAGIPEDEMFAKGLFKWTGKRTLADYIASCTCEHYKWAEKQIRPTIIRKGIAQAQERL